MPANFPEIWERRVINNLDNSDTAPWLAGIPELSSAVTVLGAGSESEQNIIHVANSDFEVDVLINNNTYPIPVQVYEDGTIQITLDKYQTKVVSLSDDQIIGSSYPLIDNATGKTVKSVMKSKYGKALHSLAPLTNVAKTPVLEATGATVGDRKRLIYDDLVNLKTVLDDQSADEEGRRIVLSTDHWNDLLLDRNRFGDKLVNYERGKPAPIIAGLELFSYINPPRFDATTKAKIPFGAIPTAGQKKGSVLFYVDNVAKKTGLTKQYFKQASGEPTVQANQLAYRHYFVATPFQARYAAAII